MLLPLLLLFTLLPLAELILLIKIGQAIDWPATIGLVVVTGVVGWWLAKREGLRTLRGIQSELAAGRLPGDRMVDALLILLAGAVLITPGIITDLIGFSLLIPPIRAVVRRRLEARFRSKIVVTYPPHVRRDAEDDLIDVEAHAPEDEPRP